MRGDDGKFLTLFLFWIFFFFFQKKRFGGGKEVF